MGTAGKGVQLDSAILEKLPDGVSRGIADRSRLHWRDPKHHSPEWPTGAFAKFLDGNSRVIEQNAEGGQQSLKSVRIDFGDSSSLANGDGPRLRRVSH